MRFQEVKQSNYFGRFGTKSKKIIVNPTGNMVREDEDILVILGNDFQKKN